MTGGTRTIPQAESPIKKIATMKIRFVQIDSINKYKDDPVARNFMWQVSISDALEKNVFSEFLNIRWANIIPAINIKINAVNSLLVAKNFFNLPLDFIFFFIFSIFMCI